MENYLRGMYGVEKHLSGIPCSDFLETIFLFYKYLKMCFLIFMKACGFSMTLLLPIVRTSG
jgi:hypothetical protein